MRIGVDISQTAYPNTGVANYLTQMLRKLLEKDTENQYIFFFSSLRGKPSSKILKIIENNKKVTLKRFTFPPMLLDLLWNKLHILPIEQLIGEVDVFLSSDWTEPPVKKAKKVTILYDLIVYKYPQETDQKIIQTQKRKLNWVKKEVSKIICISESTKQDAMEILHIDENKVTVAYPGGLI